MFTGIIEQTGEIIAIDVSGTNISFTIAADMAAELKPDQSVSHNGACLTVETVQNNTYTVTAIEETLQKTNLGSWEKGTIINLERCLMMNGRLDGHIVQGHVDTVAKCTSRKEKKGSWEFSFDVNKKFASLVVEKGSICLNGISLTIFNVKRSSFSVAIIPYTFEHTNMHSLQVKDKVNVEFDMIGKYVNRIAHIH